MKVIRKIQQALDTMYIRGLTCACALAESEKGSRAGRAACVTALSAEIAGTAAMPSYADLSSRLNDSIESFIKLAQGSAIALGALISVAMLLWGLTGEKAMSMAWERIKKVWICVAAILLIGLIAGFFKDIIGDAEFEIK